MPDQGSQSNLIDDINLKVTTNGAQENTGARVNLSLRNIVDTIYAAFQAGDAAVFDALLASIAQRAYIADLSIQYSFNTSIAPPVSGSTFLFNNATFASVTECYIHKVGAASDLTGFYEELASSSATGYLVFKSIQTGLESGITILKFTGVTDSGDYMTLAVTPLAGGLFPDGQLTTLDICVSGTSAGVPSLERTYPQTAHGFAQFDLLRVSGDDTHAKAQADDEATSVVDVMVSEVIDANTFKAVQPGSIIEGLSGLTPGPYFLSGTTAGAMETSDTGFAVSAPVGEAQTPTRFLFRPFRPSTAAVPSPSYTTYIGWMNQAGTSDPVLTMKYNGAGITPTLTRSGAGVYELDIPEVVDLDEIDVLIAKTIVENQSSGQMVGAQYSTSSRNVEGFDDTGAASDFEMTANVHIAIEIRVWA